MCKTLLILVFVAVFATALAVDCPATDDPHFIGVYFPHETECAKFYECTNGIARLFDCPAGLYWDRQRNVCNWDVDCGGLHK